MLDENLIFCNFPKRHVFSSQIWAEREIRLYTNMARMSKTRVRPNKNHLTSIKCCVTMAKTVESALERASQGRRRRGGRGRCGERDGERERERGRRLAQLTEVLCLLSKSNRNRWSRGVHILYSLKCP